MGCMVLEFTENCLQLLSYKDYKIISLYQKSLHVETVNREAANRNAKVEKLGNEIDNLKLDGTKLREENVNLIAEIEQLKFQLQWKQTSLTLPFKFIRLCRIDLPLLKLRKILVENCCPWSPDPDHNQDLYSIHYFVILSEVLTQNIWSFHAAFTKISFV